MPLPPRKRRKVSAITPAAPATPVVPSSSSSVAAVLPAPSVLFRPDEGATVTPSEPTPTPTASRRPPPDTPTVPVPSVTQSPLAVSSTLSAAAPVAVSLRNKLVQHSDQFSQKQRKLLPSTLLEVIVSARPSSVRQLQRLKGVGPQFMAYHGADVMQILKSIEHISPSSGKAIPMDNASSANVAFSASTRFPWLRPQLLDVAPGGEHRADCRSISKAMCHDFDVTTAKKQEIDAETRTRQGLAKLDAAPADSLHMLPADSAMCDIEDAMVVSPGTFVIVAIPTHRKSRKTGNLILCAWVTPCQRRR